MRGWPTGPPLTIQLCDIRHLAVFLLSDYRLLTIYLAYAIIKYGVAIPCYVYTREGVL